MAEFRPLWRTFALGLCGAWIACAPAPDREKQIVAALDAGRAEEAYELAGEWQRADSLSAPARRLLAQAAYESGRIYESCELADRAVELAPDDPEAHLVKAFANQVRFRHLVAVDAARRATELDASEPRYEVALGELYLEGGLAGTADLGEAQAAFGRALALDSTNVRARFGMGKALVSRGRHQEGEPHLDYVIEREPSHGEAHYQRGIARMRRRALEESANDFRSAIELAPSLAPAYFNLARVAPRLGRREEADQVRQQHEIAKDLNDLVQSVSVQYYPHPGNVAAGMRLAGLFRDLGHVDRAYRLATSIAKDHAALPAALVTHAEMALAAEQTESARLACTRAVEGAPANAKAHAIQASFLASVGDSAGALSALRKATDLAPTDTSLRPLLGRLLLATDDPEAARFYRALGPDRRPMAAAGFGRATFLAGNAEEAIRWLSRAIDAQPRRVDWIHTRAMAYKRLGQSGRARDDLQSVLELSPDHLTAHLELAELLEDRRPEEAARLRERHEELAARERDIEEARAAVQKAGNAENRRRLADVLREAGRTREAARWDRPDPRRIP